MAHQTVNKSGFAPNAEDLLAFTRLMQAARSSRVNFPRALNELAGQIPEGKPQLWATELSEKMARGHSLGEAIKSLEGIDDTLAALLAVPGGYGFEAVLMAYSRYLVLFTKLSEQVRTAVFYPLLMLWLSVMNIALLNMLVFPAMQTMFDAQNQDAPLIVKLLAIGDGSNLPVSLPLPLLIIGLAVVATRTWLIMPPHEMPDTLFGKFLALPQMAHAERTGRFQYLISLFVRAGYRITDAVRLAAGLGTAKGVSRSLIEKAERLERGENIICAIGDDDVLLPICGGLQANAAFDDVADALEMASASNVAVAGRLTGRIESVGLILGLFIVGVVVLVLTLAFFDPYFTLVRGAM